MNLLSASLQNTFVAKVLTFATTPPLHEIITLFVLQNSVAKVFLYATTFATTGVAKQVDAYSGLLKREEFFKARLETILR